MDYILAILHLGIQQSKGDYIEGNGKMICNLSVQAFFFIVVIVHGDTSIIQIGNTYYWVYTVYDKL